MIFLCFHGFFITFFQAHFFTNKLTFSEWTNLVSPKILAIPGKNHQIYILNFDLRPCFCRHLRIFRKKKLAEEIQNLDPWPPKYSEALFVLEHHKKVYTGWGEADRSYKI